jgi:hypothetical protein
MDLMVPDESPTTERQYKHLIKAFEDYTRVVLAPDQKIPFEKSGEPHYTVHEHNSTMRVSCRGCLELADDLQGNE